MLTINQSAVIYEIFDSEVVIINLSNGSYYSLDKSGAEIWRFLKRPKTQADIVQGLSNRYLGDRAQIELGVGQFLDELQQNSLIVSTDTDDTEGSSRMAESDEIIAGATKLPFEAPIVHKYTDMEELLLLDPIHEVDEMGWPNVKPDQP
jgi:hypothetical protein